MYTLKKWIAYLQADQARDIYPTTPLAPNTTRMIRLLPQQEEHSSNTPIKCELFDYHLSEPSGGEKHIYEALSYVWDSELPSQSITLNGHAFLVTGNLHAALWHLRDRQLERVLWVDALCINQADSGEKERQLPLMRTIYAQAARVVVWLGPPLDLCGDEALRNIRLLARARARGRRPAPRDVVGKEYEGCVMVLRRDWFRRIWVRVSGFFSCNQGCGDAYVCTTLTCGNGPSRYSRKWALHDLWSSCADRSR